MTALYNLNAQCSLILQQQDTDPASSLNNTQLSSTTNGNQSQPPHVDPHYEQQDQGVGVVVTRVIDREMIMDIHCQKLC